MLVSVKRDRKTYNLPRRSLTWAFRSEICCSKMWREIEINIRMRALNVKVLQKKNYTKINIHESIIKSRMFIVQQKIFKKNYKYVFNVLKQIEAVKFTEFIYTHANLDI